MEFGGTSGGGNNRGFLHFEPSDSPYAAERAQAAMTSILRRRTRVRENQPRICADDAFCRCYSQVPCLTNCFCGEPGKVLEWVWDDTMEDSRTLLINNNRDVRFHLHFSIGTAVIRGNTSITDGQHYWEVKMTSLVYGTDMMVGVGTHDADIQKFSNMFCSVLGIDDKTWGLSYKGNFHHEGQSSSYTTGFGQGSIIGVHLNMWNGTLSFYKNRQPLGIACGGLKGKTLYPMVSSTAARSGMRIIHSVSFPSSLQFLCCVALRKAVPRHRSVFEVVPMPRPLKAFLSKHLGWLLGNECQIDLDDRSPSPAGPSGMNTFEENPIPTVQDSVQIDTTVPVITPPPPTPVSLPGSQKHGTIFVKVPSPSATRDYIYVGRGVLVQECRPGASHESSDSDSEDDLSSSSKKMKVTAGIFGYFEGPL